MSSHGFAIEKDEDIYVQDDVASTKRTIICGTEKGKHKCKNAKTAGKFLSYLEYSNFKGV